MAICERPPDLCCTCCHVEHVAWPQSNEMLVHDLPLLRGQGQGTEFGRADRQARREGEGEEEARGLEWEAGGDLQ